MNRYSRLTLLAMSVSLGACTTALQSDKINYKSATPVQAPDLQVPPDLTQLMRDGRYAVPGAPVTASSYQMGAATQQAAGTPTAISNLGDVRIERAGTQRWLVIDRPADKLWGPVKDFWQANGFALSMDQADLGIMETDWAENRAKLPQDIIRQTLGKILDSLYSTGERDKFRTRLERNDKGGTDIFISHRGMVEVFNSSAKDQTVWQPRPVDPELEAEFLQRLMVKLGASEPQAKELVASAAAPQAAQVITVNGQASVQLDDSFDRAWRRVGLALDRTNFTVEDRDRSKGIYFVRYVAPNADKAEAGFFGKLFNSAKGNAAPQKFQINVTSKGTQTLVTVNNTDGTAADPAQAQRIVKVLAEDLK